MLDGGRCSPFLENINFLFNRIKSRMALLFMGEIGSGSQFDNTFMAKKYEQITYSLLQHQYKILKIPQFSKGLRFVG